MSDLNSLIPDKHFDMILKVDTIWILLVDGVKIAKENKSNTFEEITKIFNTSMVISVFTRTVQRTLHKESY
ncbi:9630_t:CDS:2, partial [Funneliformis geosporum]